MATHIKKLFHSKRDDEDTPDSPEQSSHTRRRLSKSAKQNPALRQSLDERDAAGASTSARPGRQSGNYARDDVPQNMPQSADRGYAATSAGQQDGPLSSEFSKMSLDGTRGAAYEPSSRTQAQTGSEQAQAYGDSPSRYVGGIRRVEPENPRLQTTGIQSSHHARQVIDPYEQSEQGLARNTSIPRKEVGSSRGSSPTTSSSAHQSRLQKALPTAPHGVQGSTPNQGAAYGAQQQPRTGVQGPDIGIAAQDVISRARGNSQDTEVIEKIAPAVVHETVNRDIHHIRHEEITREIHEHEYHHRILPVIDVEVLPPRHFLPVEGGGLVEVSADEVPGRGRNWVIAETASKIPSGASVPSEPRKFTAREFEPREGEFRKYTTEDGIERTEQTWIHPPELQTGARETGQTWPLEFGTKAAEQTRSPEVGKGKGILKGSTRREAEEEREGGVLQAL